METRGCKWHADNRSLWRKGNAYKEYTKKCKGHVIRGAYQLLPMELLRIRSSLLSTNKLVDLQLWCIIMISICLFLRHDEYYNMKIEDIVWDLCIFKNGLPVALTIQVCGKRDKVVRLLMLWRMDDVPQFCPVRHLVSYIHLAGIKKKYLFPLLSNRSKRRPYSVFLDNLKSRFKDILERNNPVTKHTFRKCS